MDRGGFDLGIVDKFEWPAWNYGTPRRGVHHHGGTCVRFVSNTGSNPPSHQVGGRVPVAYDPDRPSHARITEFFDLYLGVMIFGVIGGVFTGIGTTVGALALRRRRLRDRLRQIGRPVDAEVTAVRQHDRVTANGRHPYVIDVRWRDAVSGQMQMATRGWLWSDPRPALDVGRHVRVLVDPT